MFCYARGSKSRKISFLTFDYNFGIIALNNLVAKQGLPSYCVKCILINNLFPKYFLSNILFVSSLDTVI